MALSIVYQQEFPSASAADLMACFSDASHAGLTGSDWRARSILQEMGK